eukprot:351793-Chlamydomonas_euryale.AAC.3
MTPRTLLGLHHYSHSIASNCLEQSLSCSDTFFCKEHIRLWRYIKLQSFRAVSNKLGPVLPAGQLPAKRPLQPACFRLGCLWLDPIVWDSAQLGQAKGQANELVRLLSFFNLWCCPCCVGLSMWAFGVRPRSCMNVGGLGGGGGQRRGHSVARPGSCLRECGRFGAAPGRGAVLSVIR